ncbi:hypothetical protein, conserved [Pediculus humanus corporis]|uniref:FLYWCH-type domain-containing protein n=1 Tax=Pediculus humanus subsp. corporis TaxID=121224 RepID=E0VRH8_PEDHC|nr:uncharacterized protein Phum_PHUM397890 [Pediculus humanus corporis]EEB15984.1 hypothetical protein, conserved [Pediculus humanus corporis]
MQTFIKPSVIKSYPNFTLTWTKRGKPMITHNGYDLILHNIDKKRPTRHWRCSRCWMGCKVRARLVDYKLVFISKAAHNHPPNILMTCFDI